MYTSNGDLISGTLRPPKVTTKVRTGLAVTVYELPAVLDPLVRGVSYRVEGGEPPPVWWSVVGTTDDDLEVVRCECDGGGGNNQGSEPDELSKRCLHAGGLKDGRPFHDQRRSSDTPDPPF